MATGEGQDTPSWYCDSDSDDSIVVTISQMQDEAAKLQSTAAEIRQELTGLLATLDDIESRATTEKRRKVAAKAKLESGDGVCERPAAKDAGEVREPVESDDRYRDVSTSALSAPAPAEPTRRGSGGDMAPSVDAAAAAAADSKPFDARELLESLLDAVMERQSGAGDSLEAHPQLLPPAKDEAQRSQKACLAAGGRRSVGDVDVDVDVDASAHSSDSDDHDVVVGAAASPWEAVGRRRLRRRKAGSGGSASVSSEARSSSTADDAFLLDTDADLDLVGAPDGQYLLLD